MKKTIAKILAGLAATATAMLGFGAATTASAAPLPITTDETLTFTASSKDQLTGLSLKAYKFGEYVPYTDADGTTTAYSLQTVGGNNGTTAPKIKTLINTLKNQTTGATGNYSVPDGVDPLAWAQSQNPPVFGSETSGSTSSNERKLANALASLATTPLELTKSESEPWTATATVSAGLYIIVDGGSNSNPTVPMIVGTAPFPNADGKINIKNTATPTVKKTSNCASADIGQKCTFTISTAMPNLTNRDSYTFTITDTPAKGLTIDPKSVKIGSQSTLPSSATVTPSAAFNGDGSASMVITLDKLALTGLGIKAGNQIVITYTGKLNAQVLDSSKLVNSATNSVVVNSNGAKSEAASAVISTSTFSFKKIWADGTPAKGAMFTVEKTDSRDGSNADKWLAHPANSMTDWKWVTEESQAAQFGPDDPETAVYTFQGLADGTYTIKEVRAASGANPALLPSFTVTIDHNKTSAPAVASTTAASDPWNLVAPKAQTLTPFSSLVATVSNVKNITQLPMTGAAGIILAVIAALLLFGAAFAIVAIYRRKTASRR